MVLTGHGVVSDGAQRAAGIGIERHAFTSIASAIVAAGNGQRVGVNDHNHDHNYIKEVINDNNEHAGVPVITGRQEQPANRQ